MTSKTSTNSRLIACILPLMIASSANAVSLTSQNDYNFATIKAGVDQPTNPGGSSNMDSVKTTYVAGVEIGRKMMDIFALSLEYQYRGKSTFDTNTATGESKQSSATWRARSDALMLNLAIDLVQDYKVTPYLKLGVGASKNKSNDYVYTTSSESTTTYPGKTVTKFAYQLGAGLRMATHERFNTKIEYMFIDHGKIETKNYYNDSIILDSVDASPKTGRLKDHILTIGIEFKF